MAAGLGFKTFTTGEVLTAADVNGYLMQGILVFASEAARNSAITSPQEGQFAFTKDNNSLWYYTGSAWVASGATGDIEGVTAGVGISGGGTSGTVTITNSMATEIDAKGDLVVGTGADTFARLPVGTNGYTLVADSVETTGLKWVAPSGGTTTWTAYTATTANITVGNGSLTTEYFQQGTFVAVRFRFRLGSTSSIGNDSTISLPFAASDANRGVSGQVSFWDDNDNKVYDAVAFVAGTTNIILYAANASSTYTFGSVISATVPFTWATDDSITTQFVYESV